jgi:hypothetical protein
LVSRATLHHRCLRHHIPTQFSPLFLSLITMSALDAKKPSTKDQLADMRIVLEKLASVAITI